MLFYCDLCILSLIGSYLASSRPYISKTKHIRKKLRMYVLLRIPCRIRWYIYYAQISGHPVYIAGGSNTTRTILQKSSPEFDEDIEDERPVESIKSLLDTSSSKIPVERNVQPERPAFDSGETFSLITGPSPGVNVCISERFIIQSLTINDPKIMTPMEIANDRSGNEDHSLIESGLVVIQETPDVISISSDQVHRVDENEIVLSMHVPNPSLPINSSTTSTIANAVTPTLNTSKKNPSTSGSITDCQAYAAIIPKRWMVGQLRVENEQCVVFHYTVAKLANGDNVPVVQKSVTLDADKHLRYFVDGRRVETQGTVLEQTLRDVVCLRNMLETFQRTGICNGLGVTNVNVPIGNLYVDYVQQRHHDSCTLTSKKKRCLSCMKLRKLVNQRIRSMTVRPVLKRINRKTSAAFEHRKISALIKRSTRERRNRLKAEARATALTQKLQGLKEKLACVEANTL